MLIAVGGLEGIGGGLVDTPASFAVSFRQHAIKLYTATWGGVI